MPESLKRVRGFVLTTTFLLAGYGSLGAHQLTVREILDQLMQVGAKQQTGIEDAQRDEKLGRLLIIKVGPQWYKLSDSQRVKLSQLWLATWKHAIPNGIVSIIDATTGRAVVNFHPSGKVSLIHGF